jgi:hypothetical protein
MRLENMITDIPYFSFLLTQSLSEDMPESDWSSQTVIFALPAQQLWSPAAITMHPKFRCEFHPGILFALLPTLTHDASTVDEMQQAPFVDKLQSAPSTALQNGSRMSSVDKGLA